ncbi:MAG: glycosyltransferase, partial [Bacteroidota bacterium]|nr:glycosyltransferase [Bacteroidota bacterium]
MRFSPIILFAYDRPTHMRLTIEALKKNKFADQSELFIFSDGPNNERAVKSVQAVRNYIKEVNGFKRIQIIERKENYGLGNNIIDGVTQVVNQYKRIIVMEDDLVSSPYLLQFMNNALEMYENEENVISIHGYLYPVTTNLPETFFLKGADCLGWGTWKRGWDLFEPEGHLLLKKLIETNQTNIFDFNNSYPFTQMLKDNVKGKNNSWAVRWYASAFLKNKYTLYPGRSLIFHRGGDG